MRSIIVVMLALLLGACAAQKEKPTFVDPLTENPYEKNYKGRVQLPDSKKVEAPKIFLGTDREADHAHLLEDGYDIIGYSNFEAADVDPAKLTEQAIRVKSDLALVYTKRVGGVPSAVMLDQAKDAMKAKKPVDPNAPPDGHLINVNRTYDYFASFWTKLPPPILGVHVKSNRPSQENKVDQEVGSNTNLGVDVIAVIKGSPAAAIGLKRGDTLMKLAGVELTKPEMLTETTQRFAGQAVELVYISEGQENVKSVVLNAKM